MQCGCGSADEDWRADVKMSDMSVVLCDDCLDPLFGLGDIHVFRVLDTEDSWPGAEAVVDGAPQVLGEEDVPLVRDQRGQA